MKANAAQNVPLILYMLCFRFNTRSISQHRRNTMLTNTNNKHRMSTRPLPLFDAHKLVVFHASVKHQVKSKLKKSTCRTTARITIALNTTMMVSPSFISMDLVRITAGKTPKPDSAFILDRTIHCKYNLRILYLGIESTCAPTVLTGNIILFLLPRNRYGPVKGRATNNAGEIQAAIIAIELAGQHGIKHLCIRTDSEFLVNSVLRWMNGWKRNGWIKPDGYPVANRDDFQRLDNAIDRNYITLKWEHVPGHSGIFGNECADRLAKRGAASYRH